MDRVPDHLLRAIRDMGFEYKRAGDDAKARFLAGRERDGYYSAAERLVFHGTDAEKLKSIFDYGFDPEHRSRSKKHQRFGPREYFDDDEFSAAEWGRERYPGKHIVVIVAVVLEGSAEEHTSHYKGRTADIVAVDNLDDATFVHPIGFKFYDSRAAVPAIAQTYDHTAARDDSSDDAGFDNDGCCRNCTKQAHSRCAFNCCGACCRCTAHASHGTAGECNNCNSQAKKGCANGQCGACCRNSGPCDAHDNPRGRRR